MVSESILTKLDAIQNYMRQARDHADKLYELVPKANPYEPTFHPDNKDKGRAGWHGHEINKYKFLVDATITKIKKELTNE